MRNWRERFQARPTMIPSLRDTMESHITREAAVKVGALQMRSRCRNSNSVLNKLQISGYGLLDGRHLVQSFVKQRYHIHFLLAKLVDISLVYSQFRSLVSSIPSRTCELTIGLRGSGVQGFRGSKARSSRLHSTRVRHYDAAP